MNDLYLLSSIGEKIRAQRGKGTSPRSHSYQGTESGPNVIRFVFFFLIFQPRCLSATWILPGGQFRPWHPKDVQKTNVDLVRCAAWSRLVVIRRHSRTGSEEKRSGQGSRAGLMERELL